MKKTHKILLNPVGIPVIIDIDFVLNLQPDIFGGDEVKNKIAIAAILKTREDEDKLNIKKQIEGELEKKQKLNIPINTLSSKPKMVENKMSILKSKYRQPFISGLGENINNYNLSSSRIEVDKNDNKQKF